MKNKLICLSILIISAIACLFLFNTTSYAGYQELDNLTYNVQLNEDGSADITEKWEVYIYDTNTMFKTFDLDSSKFGEITNVKVKEISKSGKVSEFIQTDTYAYHVEKGYYYGLQTEDDVFEIAWGVSVESSADRIYEISYTVKDAVKTYNDCSEFYWQFIGETNGIPADKVQGTIKLPKAVENKENIKVWAHGPLNGEIQIVDNETVSFEVNYLSEETMVETRIAVTENIFTTNENVLERYELENIIEEETAWADEANRERDRLRREQEIEEKLVKITIIALIAVGIGILIFFIIKIIKYIKILSKTEKLKPEQKLEYFRDIPDENSTPAEAAYLYYFDKEKDFKNNLSKIISATMLNLALKKAITIDKDEKNEMKITINRDIEKEKLKEDETSIHNLLIKVRSYTNEKDKDRKNRESISMKDIENYAKKYDTTFLKIVEGIEKTAKNSQKKKQNYDDNLIKESEKWRKKKSAYYISAAFCACFGGMIIPLIEVIPLLICGILCSRLQKKTRNLTQKGANEQEQWKALERFMENFSLLDEREVPELVLWDKYLVYATAFGIADKVLKQLKIKYPELVDDNYMISNNYMLVYMMSRYNFDRMLTSSMQKAYNAGVRERAARQAAASSSYSSGGGGGGGFSGGGGRRRWPEAGMGGR